MANTRHCLVVALPEGSVQHYLLTAQEILIGRSDENGIVLDWDTVSGTHCRIRRRGDRFFVKDLGSTNGTTLGGKKVKNEPKEFRVGDSLVIGLNVKARLVEVQEVADRAPKDGAGSHSDTRKLQSNPQIDPLPSINPVAAAVAKAAKGKR